MSSITSNSGAAVVNESFSAFGTRRNPATWSGAPTTADLNRIAGLSRQGYDFQTALGQSMGLNHMNGRVQDAILGRFLSADPNVPDPTNAQSYNRYSYVNNNPLTWVDPSGLCGVTFSYNPGSGGELIDNGDGTFDFSPVMGSTWTQSFDPTGCTFGYPPLANQPMPNFPEIQPPPPRVLAQSPPCVYGASSLPQSDPSNETAEGLADTLAALDAATGSLADASPMQLAKSLNGGVSSTPYGFNVTATNATNFQGGRSVRGALQVAAPFVSAAANGAVLVAGTVSVYNGYQKGGVEGAALAGEVAGANYLVDTLLIGSTSPIVGIPASLAYNRSGASEALVGAALKSGLFQARMALAGAPISTGPF